MTYAVTGASGKLGRLVADRLLDRVDPSELVLLSRDPSALAGYAERGADVRAADFADTDSLAAAFAGVDRALLISVDVLGEPRIALQQAAIDAATAAGVAHLAYTSLPRPTVDNPAGVASDHRATEEHLQASGLGWTLLRDNLYADMWADQVRQAAQLGRFVHNYGDGRAAFVTRADCAAAAAGALLAETGTATYDVTGPESLGAAELAALASTVAGHDVEAVELDDAAMTRMLLDVGLPPAIAKLSTSFGRSIREGYLAQVTTSVRDLSGVDPAPLASLLG